MYIYMSLFIQCLYSPTVAVPPEGLGLGVHLHTTIHLYLQVYLYIMNGLRYSIKMILNPHPCKARA